MQENVSFECVCFAASLIEPHYLLRYLYCIFSFFLIDEEEMFFVFHCCIRKKEQLRGEISHHYSLSNKQKRLGLGFHILPVSLEGRTKTTLSKMTKIDICHSGNSPTNTTIESIALAMLTPWNIDNGVNTDDDNK